MLLANGFHNGPEEKLRCFLETGRLPMRVPLKLTAEAAPVRTKTLEVNVNFGIKRSSRVRNMRKSSACSSTLGDSGQQSLFRGYS